MDVLYYVLFYHIISLRTSSTSVQWVPLPSMPSGQGPHLIPWGVSLHFTPGWQGLGTQEGRGCIPPIPEETEGQLSSVSTHWNVFTCWFMSSHPNCCDGFCSILALNNDMERPSTYRNIVLLLAVSIDSSGRQPKLQIPLKNWQSSVKTLLN